MLVKIYSINATVDQHLSYAVIAAQYKEQRVFVRHQHRDTWEIPGGRREMGESIDQTARRELVEETGAVVFSLVPVCDYSVTHEGKTTWGRLFFSRITQLGPLPHLEIAEVQLFENTPSAWTYPLIQPLLFEKITSWLQENQPEPSHP